MIKRTGNRRTAETAVLTERGMTGPERIIRSTVRRETVPEEKRPSEMEREEPERTGKQRNLKRKNPETVAVAAGRTGKTTAE